MGDKDCLSFLRNKVLTCRNELRRCGKRIDFEGPSFEDFQVFGRGGKNWATEGTKEDLLKDAGTWANDKKK
ncbi:hypothetical protein CDAR_378561 [Caerostris darwini]|uniref:Uncharacterized protein n=1 Tax=Caerostris darwini TaxID=1538125 RepID=A0AAV4RX98_9ARAC|nr:hypothetical protein CDAR_378561 [Caerostris darwini]